MTGKGSMHEEMRDDLAAYALGALDADEAAALEEHLQDCDACAEYLAWLEPAVDLVPASVEQLEPPERLRESLMAAVRAEAAPERASAAPPARPRRRWSIGGLVLRPATGFAAVAVLAIGAGLGFVISNSGGDDREIVQARAVGTAPAGAFVASLEHGAGGDAILHVERAPALARGDVYQAWVSRGGTVEPAASFRPGEDGSAEAALGDSLDDADAVLVTEEPTPNSEQPTSPPILRADLG